jgi:hypothetical protein
VFSSINRLHNVVFVDYLDIAILEAKSIASGFCGPSYIYRNISVSSDHIFIRNVAISGLQLLSSDRHNDSSPGVA